MSTTPTLARRIKPVSGTCRWVSRRHRVIRINQTSYTVIPLANHVRILNWASGETYSVDRDGRWCTCPSFVWHHCPIQAGGDGRCKHIAALQKLGLLPPAALAKGGAQKAAG